jgi:hypothetical protein
MQTSAPAPTPTLTLTITDLPTGVIDNMMRYLSYRDRQAFCCVSASMLQILQQTRFIGCVCCKSRNKIIMDDNEFTPLVEEVVFNYIPLTHFESNGYIGEHFSSALYELRTQTCGIDVVRVCANCVNDVAWMCDCCGLYDTRHHLAVTAATNDTIRQFIQTCARYNHIDPKSETWVDYIKHKLSDTHPRLVHAPGHCGLRYCGECGNVIYSFTNAFEVDEDYLEDTAWDGDVICFDCVVAKTTHHERYESRELYIRYCSITSRLSYLSDEGWYGFVNHDGLNRARDMYMGFINEYVGTPSAVNARSMGLKYAITRPLCRRCSRECDFNEITMTNTPWGVDVICSGCSDANFKYMFGDGDAGANAGDNGDRCYINYMIDALTPSKTPLDVNHNNTHIYVCYNFDVSHTSMEYLRIEHVDCPVIPHNLFDEYVDSAVVEFADGV